MKLNKVPTEDYVEEQHGPVYNYLYSLKTHFLQIMSANVLFVIFNIPMLFVAFLFTLYILPLMNPIFNPDNFVTTMINAGIVGNEVMNDVGTDAAYQMYYLIVMFCVMFLSGTCLICFGPFQAGFSQIYRNLYRQSGVFFLSDFKDGIKNNWKQSLGAMIVGIVTTVLLLSGFAFYANQNNKIGTVLSVLFIVLFFLFIVVQNIVYQLIVSVDLPLRKHYSNAMIFILLKFGPCLGIIGLYILCLLIIPYALISTTAFFAYAVLVFYYLTVIIGVLQYLTAFFTGGLINRYIAGTNKNDTEETEEESEETNGDPDNGESAADEPSDEESDEDGDNT